jgi:hypothetical protein
VVLATDVDELEPRLKSGARPIEDTRGFRGGIVLETGEAQDVAHEQDEKRKGMVSNQILSLLSLSLISLVAPPRGAIPI